MVETAIDRGINFLDCANVYGPMDDRAFIGHSETVLGKAIKGKRDDVVITSKVHSTVGTGPNDRGLSRYHIMREIEGTLRRMDTDHIDIYLIHGFDEETPLEESIRALDDVVRSGKTRYIGACNFAAWQVCRALWVADSIHANPIIAVQNPYNLLYRDLESEMFGIIRDQGLGAMAYSPLAVGLLTGVYRKGKPAPEGTIWATRRGDTYSEVMDGPSGDIIEEVVNVASELGKSPGQVSLAWLLSHDEITCGISGADNTEQLEDVLGAVGWDLPVELRERLDAVSDIPELAIR